MATLTSRKRTCQSRTEDEEDTKSKSVEFEVDLEVGENVPKRVHVEGTKRTTEKATFEPREDSKEESFEDILGRFARINLNKKQDTEERCFLCGEVTKLKEFAAHIHGCVEKLREEDEAMELASLAASGVPVCNSACSRRDYSHFMSHYHPPAICPVCDEQMPLYEVDAHLTLCLKKSRCSSRSVENDIEVEVEEEDMMPRGIAEVEINGERYKIDLNQLTQENLKTGRRRQIRRTETGWKWCDDSGLFIPFDPVSNQKIEKCMEKTLNVPENPNGKTDSKETSVSTEESSSTDSSNPAGALTCGICSSQNSENSETTTSSFVSTMDQKYQSKLDRKLAGKKLSKTQMAACAALIVQEKDRADSEKSVSLARLMQSFKSLGITKDNMKKQL
eukprot:jgi/Bigna1/86253/estExt_fgenesh1_pg.C_90123